MNRYQKLEADLRRFIYNLYSRIIEIFGIVVSFVAMATFVALASYCEEDPSFNTAIDGAISNFFSLPGSYYSDIMMQFFGSASYIFSIIMVSFGYQLIKYHYISFIRVITCIISIVSASFILAAMHYYNCGAIGKLIFEAFDARTNINYVLTVFSIIFLVSFSVSLRLHLSSFNFIKFFVLYVMDKFTSLEKTSIEIATESSPRFFKNKEKKSAKQVKENDGTTFALPSVELLKDGQSSNEHMSESELRNRSENLINVLNDFGIEGEISSVSSGPVVTLYELIPAAGIKSSRVIGLSSDIARYMSAVSARVAIVPGKNALGIELPNTKRQTVYLREILESNIYKKSSSALPISLGKDISGGAIVADLAKMPHLLIAGTTGSGKSVGINAMIVSLLYKLSPEECKFIMIDPKMLELSVYDDIPHLLTPVVTDPKKAVVALKWAVKEMESRYKAMSKIGVRNIEGYNAKVKEMKQSGKPLSRKVHTGFDPETGAPIYEDQVLEMDVLPYIVIIVDEMADLMLVAGKDIEIAVQRLAQMARAAGIHLIMATQRPSVDVITGTIKANFPTRISFHVSSKIDSRTILGEQGAEQLLGQGDMLYMASGGGMTRIHCPFVSDSEVEKITTYLKSQGEPRYIETITEDEESVGDENADAINGDDPMYKEAVNLILNEGKASTSFLQRHLKIGYNRAARIIDMMEAAGIVSPANHVGKREILGR